MNRWIFLFLIFAGGCDALTGALLLALPERTLDLMGIPIHPTEPIYMRFIGAFVFAVGTSYFRPLLHRDPGAFLAAARHTLASTAWIRVCIATFSLLAVAREELHLRWAVVTGTDIALATVQLFWLHRLRATSDGCP